MKQIIIVAVMLTAAIARADHGSFSASTVPGVGIHKSGRIVISNGGNAITAYRFFDDVKEALVTLRSSRSLNYAPYGGVVFDSRASVNAPMPEYLSALINDAGHQHGVDPRLVAAVAGRE